MTIKKVLVVGGAGYIGGAVTNYLLEKRIPFAVYDNLTYEHHYLKPVDFIYGDVRDKKKLKKILTEYTHVIWLAALVGDGACAIKPILTKEINEQTVGWLAKNYKGRIIFTSTCSVYGLDTEAVTEDSSTNPLSVYAKTKLAAEAHLKNKNALIFRLGTAFGISDTYSRIRMDLAVNYMTMNAIVKKKLNVFGGNQWRPFIHVKDIGKLIVENLDSKNVGIYNLATQNSTIIDVAQIIKKYTHCKIEKTVQKFQDDRNYNADVSKARKAGILHSTTKYTIEYGIQEIQMIVLGKRVKNLDLEYYSNEKHLLNYMSEYENSFRG